jgi:hypothetical protein
MVVFGTRPIRYFPGVSTPGTGGGREWRIVGSDDA